MKPTPAEVRDWAETVLRQLGDPLGHSLSVAPRRSGSGGASGTPEVPPGGPPLTSRLGIGRAGERPGEDLPYELGPDPGPGSGPGVLVTVGFADGSAVGVLLEDFLAVPEAVVKLADQLQDAVLEESGGAAVPPCPSAARHGHPATPLVIDGVPSWACPSHERGGRTRPILPGTGG